MGLFGGKNKDIDNKVKKYNPFISLTSWMEQEGLPVEKKEVFGLAATEDKLIIVDKTREFLLNKNQLRKIRVELERIERKETQTSTTKGIVGGALFGTAGAVVGSQPKEKITSVSLITTIIIDYVSAQGEDKQIKFIEREVELGVSSFIKQAKQFEEIVNKRYFPDSIVDSGTYEL